LKCTDNLLEYIENPTSITYVVMMRPVVSQKNITAVSRLLVSAENTKEATQCR